MKPSLPSLEEWDRFGATILTKEKTGQLQHYTFHDLSVLDAPVLPAPNNAGLHFYRDKGEVLTSAYVCDTWPVQDMAHVDEIINIERSHKNTVYLFSVFTTPITAGYKMYLRAGILELPETSSYFPPLPVRELIKTMGYKRKDFSMYPHTCPFCLGRAYIGFNQVECYEGCRDV